MSSGSESDDDYVPEEPEKLSEEESADEDTEQLDENDSEAKKNKRKGKQKNKTVKKLKVEKEETEKEDDTPVTTEDEKKRQDDLWAKFLEGTDTKPKVKTTETNNEPAKVTSKQNSVPENSKNVEKQSKESDKEREKRIFEFAGETIVVENNVIKERVKTAEKPSVVKEGPSLRRPAAGLSNIVGQLNKKNKLSTLEKSKLDWNTYKKEEGIEEEITSHNKGKDGYLERQDFLGRTDVRQYEIERELRMSRRSNR